MTRAMAWLVVLAVSGAAQAKDAETQCPIPAHGGLAFTVPAGWKAVCGATTVDPATGNVKLTGAKPGEFELLMTSVWVPPAQRANLAGANLKAIVQSAGEVLLPGAVETSLQLTELSGAASRGFVFTLTDKSPAPGEFKYMMQGTVVTGELLVSVTFLYRDPATGDKASALGLLKGAHQGK